MSHELGALKRREFRLELAESRRIVPVWTNSPGRGQRRNPRPPPHWWSQKRTPPPPPAAGREGAGPGPPPAAGREGADPGAGPGGGPPSLVAPKADPPDPPRIIKVPSPEAMCPDHRSPPMGPMTRQPPRRSVDQLSGKRRKALIAPFRPARPSEQRQQGEDPGVSRRSKR